MGLLTDGLFYCLILYLLDISSGLVCQVGLSEEQGLGINSGHWVDVTPESVTVPAGLVEVLGWVPSIHGMAHSHP